jgi:hypothetical protein
MDVKFFAKRTIQNHPKEVDHLRQTIPEICRILNLSSCPLINLDMWRPAYMGTFFIDEPTTCIYVNVGYLSRRAVDNKYPAFDKYQRRKLRYYKPNWLTFVAAHELAHYKQFVDGDLINKDGRYFYKDKDVNLFQGVYPRRPVEIDANKKASLVIKELHREKYLYNLLDKS